ncbi:hypothetical protein Btru_026022 [Bulinus truncatus]|nr:hypothetical protein Btru_026022 [Bulinus truncatus]
MDLRHNGNTTSCVCISQHEHDVTFNNTSTDERSTLALIGDTYGSVHGIVSLVVCTFGIPMNVLNISVLTRQHMRTPVNCILTWLAVFDLLTMVSYVPFVVHFYCLTPDCDTSVSEEKNSLGGMDDVPDISWRLCTNDSHNQYLAWCHTGYV